METFFLVWLVCSVFFCLGLGTYKVVSWILEERLNGGFWCEVGNSIIISGILVAIIYFFYILNTLN